MLQKFKHLFQRLVVCCKAFPADRREFGSKVAAARFWDVLIPTGKSKKYIQTLSAYMCKELAPLAQRFRETPVQASKQALDHTPVWVCWWQGEEAMPPVVKACVAKMRQLLPATARLHVITWDNFGTYVQLPAYILEKYEKGLISKTHLSDILRYALVSTYGGAWIDSTVLLSDRIVRSWPEYLQKDFFTQRFASWECCPQEACRGKWCNFFFMGKADCPLFAFVYEALLQWWQTHDRIIDYVILDYMIWAGYCDVPAIREAIDSVEAGNENIWLLAKHLNDAYVPEQYEKLMASNDFFKLSYKGQLNLQTQQGQDTVYAHILKENNVM